jgi:hypothetical protein
MLILSDARPTPRVAPKISTTKIQKTERRLMRVTGGRILTTGAQGTQRTIYSSFQLDATGT